MPSVAPRRVRLNYTWDGRPAFVLQRLERYGSTRRWGWYWHIDAEACEEMNLG